MYKVPLSINNSLSLGIEFHTYNIIQNSKRFPVTHPNYPRYIDVFFKFYSDVWTFKLIEVFEKKFDSVKRFGMKKC